MLKIRDAKPLFAGTVVAAPWDLVVFDDGIGWGLTFLYGRFVVVAGDPNILGPFHLLELYRELGSRGEMGVLVTLAWISSMALGAAAATYVTWGRLRNRGTTPEQDRHAGVVFLAAGALFLLSRAVGASVLTWTSIPVGAVYVVFVGVVFYRGLFRLGPG